MSKHHFMFPALLAGLAIALVGTPVEAEDNCTEDGVVCVTKIKGSAFRANKKANKKDRKRRGKGASGVLNVTINNGRGSVFVNGRFVGTAPVQYLAIQSGRNEVQVRDGMIVLAEGLLTVPRGQTLTMTILHP
jgi:hypothetical protein